MVLSTANRRRAEEIMLARTESYLPPKFWLEFLDSEKTEKDPFLRILQNATER
jgi:hypothetical protein